MTFFYDLNKKLADLAKKQTLSESAQPVAERATGDYSAKKAAAGKDIGKPGKAFAKIAKSAGERYGSKERGEKVAGAVLAKLRKGTKESVDESGMDESALQAYLGKKKYGETGMKALQKAGREGAGKEKMARIRAQHDKMDEQMADEGNAFAKAVIDAKKDGVQPGEKIRVGSKEYPVKEEGGMPMTAKQKSFAKLAPPADKITFADKIAGAKKEVDEMLGDVAAEAIKQAVKKSESRSKGTAFDPEVAKGMFAHKDEHPRYDVKDTGYSKRYTRKAEPEAEKDDAEVSDQPKKKGRPKGPAKGPERTTKGAWKHKGERKTKEDLDSDGVMMTKPSNMSSEDVSIADRGEYDQEGDMAKDQLHTLTKAANELSAILDDEQNLPEWVQSKITKALDYIKSANDYMDQEHHDKEQPVSEKAVSKKQRKAAGIAHAAQKGEIPKKELRGASKEMAKMPKGELHKFAATKEKGLPEKVKAKKEGLEKHSDAELKAASGKDRETDKKSGVSPQFKTSQVKDELKKRSKEVDETTTAGSVSTAPAEKKAKGGYNFGGSVYESLDRQFRQALSEGMNVSINMNSGADGNPTKSITVSAEGEDAEALAQLLKMAGIGGNAETCSTCGKADCGCQEIDENSPDWPTNTETSDDALQYSGGLNRPKSTGQTTVPVIASQLRRQVSMEEGVTLERSLFRLYQNYKTQ